MLYETSAIAAYVDQAFDGPPLQPDDPRERARMNRWISALNNYYYPYIAYHLSHERLIYPVLGIAPDEKVVAAALPKIAIGLDVMENDLSPGRQFLVNDQPTLADFFMLPTMTSLSLTPEGQQMLSSKPRIAAWRAAMDSLPSVIAVRAMVMPHLGKPVEHARRWVVDHRPRMLGLARNRACRGRRRCLPWRRLRPHRRRGRLRRRRLPAVSRRLRPSTRRR